MLRHVSLDMGGFLIVSGMMELLTLVRVVGCYTGLRWVFSVGLVLHCTGLVCGISHCRVILHCTCVTFFVVPCGIILHCTVVAPVSYTHLTLPTIYAV